MRDPRDRRSMEGSALLARQTVLKTAGDNTLEGSNPSPSANCRHEFKRVVDVAAAGFVVWYCKGPMCNAQGILSKEETGTVPNRVANPGETKSLVGSSPTSSAIPVWLL